MPGGEQDFMPAERLAGGLELMRQLIGVGRDLMKACEHDQTGQTGVYAGHKGCFGS